MLVYRVDPGHRGNGYATEAAEAPVTFAIERGKASLIRAQTLPAENASKRVLNKCDFRHLGQVLDPGDGWVWRRERQKEEAG